MDKFEGLSEIDGFYGNMYEHNWHHLFSLVHWVMNIDQYVISGNGPVINNDIIVIYKLTFTNP